MKKKKQNTENKRDSDSKKVPIIALPAFYSAHFLPW